MERVSSKRKRRKEELSTVWVIPRAVLDIKQCDLEQQRALIAYNLLFNGPLILVDSDYISNLNLRAAVRNGNQFFCRLFEERLVRLAIREEGKGEPTSLAKTSEMIAGRKGGLSDGTPTGDAPEFTWVERKTMPVTFSLSRAEQRYQEEILRIFCDTKFRDDDLPLTYAETLREILEERVASGGRISGSLFGPQSELWLIMEQRLNESGIRERVGQFVFDVARGPYVTFLPDSLGLSATYSQEDKIGIDLFRRRYVLAEEQLKKRTLSLRRPSLAQTVAGLARLKVSEIKRIRTSGALRAFEAASQLVAEKSPSYEKAITDALDALSVYRQEVDRAVFDALNRTQKAGDEVRDDYVFIAFKQRSKEEELQEELQAWCKFLVKTGLSKTTFGISSFLSFGFERWQAWHGQDTKTKARQDGVEQQKRQQAENERKLDEVLDEGSAIVDGKFIIDRPDIRDLCSSLQST